MVRYVGGGQLGGYYSSAGSGGSSAGYYSRKQKSSLRKAILEGKYVGDSVGVGQLGGYYSNLNEKNKQSFWGAVTAPAQSVLNKVSGGSGSVKDVTLGGGDVSAAPRSSTSPNPFQLGTGQTALQMLQQGLPQPELPVKENVDQKESLATSWIPDMFKEYSETKLPNAVNTNTLLQMGMMTPSVNFATAKAAGWLDEAVSGVSEIIGKVLPSGTKGSAYINPKSINAVASAASKSVKNPLTKIGWMAVLGISAWAGSVAFGLWGKAEAADNFPMNKIYDQARRTGNWSLYDEYKAGRDEVLNLNLWEKIGLWSPASGIFGSGMKADANINNIKAMDKMAEIERAFGEDQLLQQGVIEEQEDIDASIAKWKAYKLWAIEQDEASQARMLAAESASNDAYYQRRANERAADAQFWIDYKKKIAEMEEEERRRIMEFWLEYKKLVLKLQEDSGRSRLTFGIL